MILDYRTNNSRWGLTGMYFQSEAGLCLTLGFLSNPAHNTKCPQTNQSYWCNSVDIRYEKQVLNDAYANEGRIWHYRDIQLLQTALPDMYSCGSAGVGNCTLRVNSNLFINTLINEWGFIPLNPQDYTVYLTPPDTVRAELSKKLQAEGYTQDDILFLITEFDKGYNL